MIRSNTAATVALCAALLLPRAAGATEPATLTIKIENVSEKGGLVRVALYDKSDYDGHDGSPLLATAVEARAPVTVVKVPAMRPGEYAVKLFQDYYRTGAFVTSALGVPEEPFGFSNDARPLLDQPSFADTKFNVSGGTNEITVHLQSTF